jgi:hypothetical protein
MAAAMVLVALLALPAAAADADKAQRTFSHVGTLQSMSADGDVTVLRLDDGTTLRVHQKNLRFKDSRDKTWRTGPRLSADARKAGRDHEARKAARAEHRAAKNAARASGKKNIRKKDVAGLEPLALKSLASGQPVYVTVRRDRDGAIRSVRVQAVKDLAEVREMLAARESAKQKRAAERAAKSR